MFQILSGGNTRKAQPGDGVFWSQTTAADTGVVIPNSAANVRMVVGIIGYDPTMLPKSRSSIPSGASAPTQIEYDDGDLVPVVTQGVVWVNAAAGVDPYQRLRWNTTNNNWEGFTVAAADVIGATSIRSLVVARTTGTSTLIKAYISMGGA